MVRDLCRRSDVVKATCTIPNCEGLYARGLCSHQYDQWRRAGKPAGYPTQSELLSATTGLICSAPDCDKPIKLKKLALCGMHAERLRTRGSLDDSRFSEETRFWAKVAKGDGSG